MANSAINAKRPRVMTGASLRNTNDITRVPSRAIYEQVIIVTRETELESLTARFNTVEQAKFYLEHAGQSFAPIEQSHARYQDTLNQLRDIIPRGVKSQIISRDLVPQFTFAEHDLVITIGQDGLVVNTAKYLTHQPIIAINPDPSTIEGALLPFDNQKGMPDLKDILSGKSTIKKITMANATMNDGQELLAFNDLFIGPRSHTSARYDISQGNQTEYQSSSGVIISTGAGSTGWMRSVYTGAVGIINALGGEVKMPDNDGQFEWDENLLMYAVREPWPSKNSQANMVFGVITPDKPLTLTSHMSDYGVIFSDGIEKDYLAFNAGLTATIQIADTKAHLITP